MGILGGYRPGCLCSFACHTPILHANAHKKITHHLIELAAHNNSTDCSVAPSLRAQNVVFMWWQTRSDKRREVCKCSGVSDESKVHVIRLQESQGEERKNHQQQHQQKQQKKLDMFVFYVRLSLWHSPQRRAVRCGDGERESAIIGREHVSMVY